MAEMAAKSTNIIDHHKRQLATAKEAGNRREEGHAYNKLGNAYQDLNNFLEAIDCHSKHLGIAQEMGNREEEGLAFGNLGNIYCCLGKIEEGRVLSTLMVCFSHQGLPTDYLFK